MEYSYFVETLNGIEEVDENIFNNLLKIFGERKLIRFYEDYINDKDVPAEKKLKKIEVYLNKYGINVTEKLVKETISKTNFNGLDLYLNELIAIKPLSEREETELFDEINKLKKIIRNNNITKQSINEKLEKFNINPSIKLEDTIKEIKRSINNLSKDEQIELEKILEEVIIYKKFNDLVNKCVESNLKLVVFWANSFPNKKVYVGDLIQEGNIGLRKAVINFEPTKGVKFGTYASYQIFRPIYEIISNFSKPIMIRQNINVLINAVKKAELELETILFRSPKNEEIIEYIYKKFMLKKEKQNILEETIEKNMKAITRHIDLFRMYGKEQLEEDLNNIEDILEDKSINFEEETLNKVVYEKEIIKMFSKIKSNQKFIIIMRYGLNLDKYMSYEEFSSTLLKYHPDLSQEELINKYQTLCLNRKPLTMPEVGRILGITRQSIEQIEDAAFEKILAKTKKRNIF